MAGFSPSIRRDRLEDRTFTAGGHVSIPTQGKVPKGRRILGLEFTLDATITQPGAAAAAQLGAVLHQLVAKFFYGRRIDIDGLGAHFLGWKRRGRELDFPAGFPATLGAVFSRRISWAVDFSDYNARGGTVNDGVITTEMFERDEIEVDFGTTAIFAATAPTVTGTLRTSVVHDSARGRKTVPVSRIIRSENFSALTAKLLKAGKYEHIIMYRLAPNDPGNLTDTQVPNLTLSIGGDPILALARPQDLGSTFNRTRATGPNVRLESQTAPLSGEALTVQPGFAAAAGLGVTLEWIPIDVTPSKHLLSSLAEGAATIDVGAGGTVTTYRIAYVMVEPRSADQEARAATMQGAPTADLHLNLAAPPTGEVDSIRRYAPLIARPTRPEAGK